MKNPGFDPEDVLREFELGHSVFGSFKDRLLASLIDGLVLLPLVLVDWFNKSSFKILPLMVITFLVGFLYKLLFELKYGATIGKMALKLKVVNKEFQRVNLPEVVLRNIFDIVQHIFVFVVTLTVYLGEDFGSIRSNAEFVAAHNQVVNMTPFLYGFTILSVIEAVVLISDKKRRAIHDFIGGTFVIKTNTL